ncbi:hypothetical protein CKO15_09130 [Halorhodospira abdelmalekii]|uniref:DUF4007 family protein n=1 Tax=Halorhodospira abdelmalekii TaxID=421629 RepID=UPI0019088AC8|nr:DUF4007 family protein [Halorhodospira abdelmalekii]MBK1735442.1 hypothetical protein [Halorhodospira abdelmalekii]
MQLNLRSTSFGRHETFPLRYGWLPKGYTAVAKDPAIFLQPEEAMVRLGVGRNMVNAIRYWLIATGVVGSSDSNANELRPNELGKILFGEGLRLHQGVGHSQEDNQEDNQDDSAGVDLTSDPYLEDDATLWILHWLIAANATQATGFFWFFNRFSTPHFREKELLEGLRIFVADDLQQAGRSLKTLESDVSVLLRMYATVPGRTDEHLDSPLANLGLIEPDPEFGYRSLRTARPLLPSVALHFALAQRFAAEPEQPALPVRALLYGDDGKASPGAVFRLSESSLMERLEAVCREHPGHYELRDTAGVHQLYRIGEPPDPLAVLANYYQGSS